MVMYRPKKSIPGKLWAYVQKHGVLSGSQVYGGATESSDYDYLISEKCSPPILKFLWGTDYYTYKKGDYRTEHFLSVYVLSPDDNLVNLILFVHDEAFELWCKATKLLKVMTKIPIVRKMCRVKRSRVLLFEALLYSLDTYYGSKVVVEDVYRVPKSGAEDDDDIPF